MKAHPIRFALAAIPFTIAGVCMTATAQTGDDATITFKRGATAQETYASIEKSARDYCRDVYANSSAISSVWPTSVSNCTVDMVDRTIRQLGSAELSGYHVAVTRAGEPAGDADSIIIVTAEK